MLSQTAVETVQGLQLIGDARQRSKGLVDVLNIRVSKMMSEIIPCPQTSLLYCVDSGNDQPEQHLA
jgi:hypothetical protein